MNDGTTDFQGKILEVDRDLALSPYSWVPIGTDGSPFRGVLIAKGGGPFSISDIKVSGSYGYAGFIGSMENATIGGFTLSGTVNVNAAGDLYAGGIAGTVTSSGGSNSYIYDVTNFINLNLTATNGVFAGGIAGSASGTISNAANKGTVEVAAAVSGSSAGGIAGINSGELVLKTVSNTAAVSSKAAATSVAGGILGQAGADLLMADGHTAVVNSGSVTAEEGTNVYSGGIVGRLASAAASATFSNNTANSGKVEASSANSTESYAGSLAALIERDFEVDFNFISTGQVVNHAKDYVYTGGLAGRVKGSLTLSRNYKQTAAVEASASGTEYAYTGAVAGYVDGDISAASGFSLKNEAALRVVGSAASHVYTGGLFGAADGTVAFDSTLPGAYANSGDIEVTGRSDVYTGGIIAAQAYGKAADNVLSAGNITVTGEKALYTGGYIGKVAGAAADLKGEKYARRIVVNGNATLNTDLASGIFTGGIVGFYETSGVLEEAAFTGEIAAAGGEYTYTGGVAGYLGAGTVKNVQAGNTAAAYASIASTGSAGGVAGYAAGAIESSNPQYISVAAQGQDGLPGRAGAIAGETALAASIGSPSSPLGVKNVSVTSEGDHTRLGGAVGENRSSSVYIVLPLDDADELTVASDGDDSAIGGVFGKNSAPLAAANLSRVANIKVMSGGRNAIVGGIIGDNYGVLDSLGIRNPDVSSEGQGTMAGLLAGRSSGSIVHPEVFGEDSGIPKLAVSGRQSVAGGIVGFLDNAAITGNGTDADIADVRIAATGEDSAAGGIAGKSRSSDVQSVIVDSPVITISGNGSTAGGITGEATGEQRHIADSAVLRPLITANGDNSKAGGIAGYTEVEIADSSIAAYDGEYSVLKVGGSGSFAGGIAAKAIGVSISGDAQSNNIESLLINVLATADGATVGGAVGWNEGTSVRKLYADSVKMTVSAPNAKAGGLAGYNKGTETAVIADNYMSEVQLTAASTAGNSTLGGIVGLNDGRDGSLDSGDPKTAVSSIRNNRILGSLTVNSPDSKVGGLAGENRSVVANNSISDGFRVSSQGSGNTVGGLVGLNTKTVFYSFSNAGLTLGGSRVAAGGLVGENTGLVSSSYIAKDVTAQISGTSSAYAYLGGLIGKNSGIVEKSYTSSVVTANGAYVCVGGLTGWQAGGSVTSSYAAKNVLAKGSSSFSGGLLGRITAGTIGDSYSAGRISGASGAYSGGFAGRYDTANKELLNNSYYVKDESLGINSGLLDFAAGNYYELKLYMRLSPILSASLADREAFKTLSGWDFSSQNRLWKYGSSQAEYAYPELVLDANSGGGSPQTDVGTNISWYTQHKDELRFYIDSEAELAGLAAIVNGSVTGLPKFDFAGRVVEVTAPVTIQSAQWAPVGNSEENAFQGSFDGGNHLISGLRADGQDFTGLFGVIGNRGEVRNVKLAPVSVTGTGSVGGLAGLNKGSIAQVEVILADGAYVSGGDRAGGVAGESRGTVRDVAVTVDSSGEVRSETVGAAVGGVIGEASAGSLADANIALNGGQIKGTGSGSSSGGAVGVSGAGHSISGIRLLADNAGVVNPVNITGHGNAGGIAGDKKGKGIAEWDVADVTVEHVVISSGNGGNAGGIVGTVENGAVRNAVFAGAIRISADGVSAGGLAGKSLNSILYKGKATPELTLSTTSEESYVGGLAGIIENTGSDTAFDFGKLLPVYRGITLSESEGGTISVQATGYRADVSVGGVAGKNASSSVYETSSDTKLEATGVRTVNIGGIAGWNEGDIIGGTAASDITASDSGIYNAGGVVGFTSGGRIVYSRADGGKAIAIGSAAAIQQVTPATYAGGFAGRAADTTIRNSSADSVVTVYCDNAHNTVYAGGFAGLLQSGIYGSGTIKRSYAQGSVTVSGKSGSYAGGFAGSIEGYVIEEAYASATVANTAFDARSGGFAGVIEQSATIEQAYAVTSSVEAKGSHGATRAYAGGFAGYNNGSLTETYASALRVASVANGSNSYVGSFIGYNFRDGQVNGSYYADAGKAGIGHGTSAQSLEPVDFSGRQPLAGWDFSTDDAHWAYLAGVNGDKPVLRNITNWTFAPDLTFLMEAESVDELVIFSERQLGAAVLLSNDEDLSFYRLYDKAATQKPRLSKLRLEADLNLSGSLWIPFEQFEGVFDGNGKTIAGMSYYGMDYDRYGFVRSNKGTISNIAFKDARIEAGGDVGIVAGENAESAVISTITISGEVAGSGDYVGGAAGKSEGSLTGITVRGLRVDGRHYVGGVAGAAAGISTVTAEDVTVKGQSFLGGAVGKATGLVRDITARNVTVEAAAGTAAGIVPENEHGVQNVKLSGAAVTGSGLVGGIVGKSSSVISDASVQGELLAHGGVVGGIAGSNEGTIENSRFNGLIAGTGQAAGGIAGDNGARITESYATGSVELEAADAQVKVGGIAGTNGSAAIVEESFSSASVRARGDNASAGGIAGENEGSLRGVLNAGNIEASGASYARAGGVAGYALAGSINNALSYGQVEGSINGRMVYKKTFYGGIAGQAEEQASFENSYSDRQMLKEIIAYSDSSGHFVRSVQGKAVNAGTAALTEGDLPAGLDDQVWRAQAGFYPRLIAFDGVDTAKLAAAAVKLNERDTAYDVKSDYVLTQDSSIVWSTVRNGGVILLTASLQQESRTIAVNKPALMYADTAGKPSGLTDSTFKESVQVSLTTDEAGGVIHYTLDGSLPTEESPVYDGELTLSKTTTVRAIVKVEGKNDSDAAQAVYTKEAVSGGEGGGGFPAGGGATVPPTDSDTEIWVNGKAENVGTEKASSEGGRVTTTISVNEEAMNKLLQTYGDNAEIAVVFNKKSEVSAAELSAQLVKAMADTKAFLKVDIGNVAYRIPAAQLYQEAILQRLGGQAAAAADVRVRIEISIPEQARQLEQAASNGGYTFVVPPTAFKVTYALGSTVAEASLYDAYVERSFVLSSSAPEASGMAGVSVAEDGTVSPVPTRFSVSGGTKAAVMKSLASGGTFAIVSSEANFRDLSAHWAKQAINDLGVRLILNGTGTGLFEPNRSITRAEFAAIAVKALGLQGVSSTGSALFTDVKAADWYAPYVGIAYQFGLISGYSDGSFGGKNSISREQAMVIIARAMKLAGLQATVTEAEAQQLLASFADADEISGYAKADIAASVKAGLVSGRSGAEGTAISPGEQMTRAEVAAIIRNLLNLSGLI
ncbi:S-layer homology domain-containing protein [Cohnella faecalis]|uniref:SLH domain-containing protein n=1 Tax=Cohnella faecalis TaxID=2315694 RepID=A0A398CI51_9BACL|nr:S-layer homology domain-containing protein [Cohnella faecalis]RIE02946.1 hypothetical protein D3H35_20280 [Cohnella faecalis]